MSAGQSATVLVEFAPKVNRDIDTALPFIAQSGPFAFPLRCFTRKVAIAVTPRLVEFNGVTMGEEASSYVLVENSGAVAVPYHVRIERVESARDAFGVVASVLDDLDAQKGYRQTTRSALHTFGDSIVARTTTAARYIPTDTELVEEKAVLAAFCVPDDDGMTAGRGVIDGYSSRRIHVRFRPLEQGAYAVKLRLVFGADAKPPQDNKDEEESGAGQINWFDAKRGPVTTYDGDSEREFDVTVRATACNVPILIEQRCTDMQCCVLDKLYRSVVRVSNRSKHALKFQLPVPPVLRGFVEFTPNSGYIQAFASLDVHIKFMPRTGLLERIATRYALTRGSITNGDSGTELDSFCVPVTLVVPEQVLPVSFDLAARLCSSELSFSPGKHLDFGSCPLNQTSVVQLAITNSSPLNQHLVFTNLRTIKCAVQPGDGFVNLLPFECVTVNVSFAPTASVHYKFDLQCESKLGRKYTLHCVGRGKEPTVVARPSLLKLPAVADGSKYHCALFLANTSKEAKLIEIAVPSASSSRNGNSSGNGSRILIDSDAARQCKKLAASNAAAAAEEAAAADAADAAAAADADAGDKKSRATNKKSNNDSKQLVDELEDAVSATAHAPGEKHMAYCTYSTSPFLSAAPSVARLEPGETMRVEVTFNPRIFKTFGMDSFDAVPAPASDADSAAAAAAAAERLAAASNTTVASKRKSERKAMVRSASPRGRRGGAKKLSEEELTKIRDERDQQRRENEALQQTLLRTVLEEFLESSSGDNANNNSNNLDDGNSMASTSHVVYSSQEEQLFSRHSRHRIPVFVRSAAAATTATATASKNDAKQPEQQSKDENTDVFFVELHTTTVRPHLVASPEAHDFGQVAVGSFRTQTIELRNVGTEPIAALDVQPLGLSSSFHVLNPLRAMQPGDVQLLLVDFRPTRERSARQDLVIRTATSHLTIPLRGVSVTPQITVEPHGLLDFGDVRCGDSAEQTVTLTNKSKFPFSYAVDTTASASSQHERNLRGMSEFFFSPERGVVAPHSSRTITCVFSPDHVSDRYAVHARVAGTTLHIVGRGVAASSLHDVKEKHSQKPEALAAAAAAASAAAAAQRAAITDLGLGDEFTYQNPLACLDAPSAVFPGLHASELAADEQQQHQSHRKHSKRVRSKK
jgi:hypothetical protein